ncbi:hypothetical protein RHSIM_Rhsim11G0030600 [Rhododendron simsii]|uniref:SMAX1-like nucleotide binding domain-containing protein n=1 Tax=Rhododendron simsii TaxID=118357 RepID=A0A834LB84_RHOSS|nr:hypothetical protein RHSIM_Rhsim11G0030600 [Rhododendron simsii]
MSRSLFPSVSHYSSWPSFDESLLKVIESEIKCAEESDDQDEVRERVLLGDLMMWSSIANLKENLHKITLDVHNDDGDEGLEIYNLPDRKGHLHTDRRFPYCFAHSSPASHSPMANGFDSPYNDELLRDTTLVFVELCEFGIGLPMQVKNSELRELPTQCPHTVKSNLEDSVFHSVCGGGAGVYSTPSSPSPPEISHREISNFWQTHFLNFNPEQNPLFFSPQKKLFFAESVKEEDIKLVLEVLCRKNKKRNTVIVGDSSSITEAVVPVKMS